MTATATEAPAPAKDSFAAFTQRLVEAGAPALPGGLVYIVQYVPHGGDHVRVILDIRDMTLRKLLASEERYYPRRSIRVMDFVRMAEACVEQLSYESKLPKAVRELLVGADA